MTPGLGMLGCSSGDPATYRITGTVCYQGNPLPLGTVMFVPDDGPSAGPTPIQPDGRYELHAVAGEHAVQVVAMPPRQGGRPDPNVEGGIDFTGAPKVTSLIPRKYNRFDTSGIRVRVESAGPNQIDIELP